MSGKQRSIPISEICTTMGICNSPYVIVTQFQNRLLARARDCASRGWELTSSTNIWNMVPQSDTSRQKPEPQALPRPRAPVPQNVDAEQRAGSRRVISKSAKLDDLSGRLKRNPRSYVRAKSIGSDARHWGWRGDGRIGGGAAWGTNLDHVP
ncbi:hypothetical protein H4582DRAFT_1961693 [Lactarius indigo]|nr:hypothetical protein H4582DRAFT_1961693 [Lactarius indigo]